MDFCSTECTVHAGTWWCRILLIINLDTRWQWFSFMSRALYPWRQIAPYQLNRIWLDPPEPVWNLWRTDTNKFPALPHVD